jgi:Putative amidoligase enzyme
MITKAQLIDMWYFKPANMDLIVTKEEENYNEETDEHETERSLRIILDYNPTTGFKVRTPRGQSFDTSFSMDWVSAFHLKKGHFAKFEKIGLSKKPKTVDKHIGVEIEFISNLSEDELKAEFADNDLEDYVNLKGDNSVENSDSHPFAHELCILATESKIADIVTQVCKILKTSSKVNASCGLHVHLDMRHRDKTESYKRLYVAQPLLYAMCPSSRYHSTYCEMMSDYEEFESDAVSDTRYCGINTQAYSKYRTIEVRIHSGTIDASKINNWIELLMQIVDSKRAVAPKLNKDYDYFKTVFNLSDTLDAYIKERVTKFKSKHRDAIVQIDLNE